MTGLPGTTRPPTPAIEPRPNTPAGSAGRHATTALAAILTAYALRRGIALPEGFADELALAAGGAVAAAFGAGLRWIRERR